MWIDGLCCVLEGARKISMFSETVNIPQLTVARFTYHHSSGKRDTSVLHLVIFPKLRVARFTSSL